MLFQSGSQIHLSAMKQPNSLFTKFLKRYLGLPYSANNAITHFLTGTIPLSDTLKSKALKAALRISYPSEINGASIALPIPKEDLDIYSPYPQIPPYFWTSPVVNNLPHLSEPRRALLYEALDITHFHICKTKKFHLEPEEDTCICRFCDASAPHYHHRECPQLRNLSPSALMRKTKDTRSGGY